MALYRDSYPSRLETLSTLVNPLRYRVQPLPERTADICLETICLENGEIASGQLTYRALVCYAWAIATALQSLESRKSQGTPLDFRSAGLEFMAACVDCLGAGAGASGSLMIDLLRSELGFSVSDAEAVLALTTSLFNRFNRPLAAKSELVNLHWLSHEEDATVESVVWRGLFFKARLDRLQPVKTS